MTKTTTIIEQNSKYNLRDYYNKSMSSWQKQLLSRELTNTLLDENASPGAIFFVIMSQTSVWHVYSRFSPNPVIRALLQLPAAQACMTLNQHGLLTQANCDFILEAQEPESMKAAILALSKESILNEPVLNVVLQHPAFKDATELLVFIHRSGISLLEIVSVFASFEQCIRLMGINPQEKPYQIIKAYLVTIYLGLSFASQLTAENISAFEQSKVFIHSEANPKLTAQIKLQMLAREILLLQRSGLMGSERFNDLLEHIDSEFFFQALDFLSTGRSSTGTGENILTAATYELVKKSPNIRSLSAGIHSLHAYGQLTMDHFIEIAEHDQPAHLARILKLMNVYKNVHHVTLSTEQYHTIKNDLNLKQLSDCLEQLFRKHLFTQDNLDSLIEYGGILFNKNEDNGFWKQIPSVTQRHLDEIFLQCKQDRVSNSERAERVQHIEGSINKINRLLNHEKITLERDRAQLSPDERGLFSLFDDFGIPYKHQPIAVPQTENDKIIDTIQIIILKQQDVPYSRILIAFHLDKTKTLCEAFKKLNIDMDKTQLDERFIFAEDIFHSEELFRDISASMIAFAQQEIKQQDIEEEEKVPSISLGV